MKIEYDIDERTKIENIKVGECFIYENHPHIKIFNRFHYNEEFPNNVLNLEDNSINAIRNGICVRKINAKIVIKS